MCVTSQQRPPNNTIGFLCARLASLLGKCRAAVDRSTDGRVVNPLNYSVDQVPNGQEQQES
jgi:hypothetical protein